MIDEATVSEVEAANERLRGAIDSFIERPRDRDARIAVYSALREVRSVGGRNCGECYGTGEVKRNPDSPDPQGEVSYGVCGACNGTGAAS